MDNQSFVQCRPHFMRQPWRTGALGQIMSPPISTPFLRPWKDQRADIRLFFQTSHRHDESVTDMMSLSQRVTGMMEEGNRQRPALKMNWFVVNMDAIPLLSQAKSLVQLACGDTEGASRTQKNFVRRCPVVSQAVALGAKLAGEDEEAEEIWKEGLETIGGFADGMPVIGHVKGAIHYACGDKKGGDEAMKSASRTAGSMAGGIVGFVVGGPVGAVVGGIESAAAMDLITTAVDSAVHEEFRPAGYFAQIEGVTENPKDPGKWFDLAVTPAFDGLAGYGAGEVYSRWKPVKQTHAMSKKIGVAATKDVVKNADMVRAKVSDGTLPSRESVTHTMVRDLKTNEVHYGVNRRARLDVGRPVNLQEAPLSELQRRIPQEISGRKANAHRACAEHQAYNSYYRSREGALPAESRCTTVRRLVNRNTGPIPGVCPSVCFAVLLTGPLFATVETISSNVSLLIAVVAGCAFYPGRVTPAGLYIGTCQMQQPFCVCSILLDLGEAQECPLLQPGSQAWSGHCVPRAWQ
ncbi:uncharacterized protein LOC132873613 isoform X2 [Neoarius graeffei]|uniref:uncharacterized protein LOC132873613 isoform X2 n=1 Tax=Neoarius graeffei TaxID=443677 RepID=UPI00298CB823|nr:uncharacterized protein LOC132873613 isoform X2 [Neoarius graeffei]